jgi:hypothetical protein
MQSVGYSRRSAGVNQKAATLRGSGVGNVTLPLVEIALLKVALSNEARLQNYFRDFS